MSKLTSNILPASHFNDASGATGFVGSKVLIKSTDLKTVGRIFIDRDTNTVHIRTTDNRTTVPGNATTIVEVAPAHRHRDKLRRPSHSN